MITTCAITTKLVEVLRLLGMAWALILAISGQLVLADEVPVGVGLSDPTLAFGLTDISDWSTEMPFLDITRSMRPWIGHRPKAWGGMKYEQLLAGGYLDANGWPTKIPPGMGSISTIWAWSDKDVLGTAAARSRMGIYVLTYEGQGTLTLGGNATVLSSEPGKIVFSIQPAESSGSISPRPIRTGRGIICATSRW